MRRLIGSHALAGTAVSLPWPALLATLWQVNDDPGLIGLAGGARFAPCVLLSAFLGGIGDRAGRFRTVRAVTFVRLGLLILTSGFMLAGLPWAAVASATLTVAAGVPAFPSLAALVPRVAADPDRATDNLVTWEISGFVVGPALGGLLLVFGAQIAVLACVPLMAAAVLVLPRRLDDAGPAVERLRLASGLRQVLSVPLVRRAIVTVMALNAVIGVLGVAMLPITEEHWRAGITEFGWVTAVHGFASLAAPAVLLLIRRLAWGLAAQLVVVTPLLALALATTWTAAALPLALLGAGLTVVECRTTRMLQHGAPVRYTALALGVADAALVGAAMIGALVAPWVLQAVGPLGLLLVLAGGSAPVLFWGLRAETSARETAATEQLHYEAAER